jgi:hypothetical protein
MVRGRTRRLEQRAKQKGWDKRNYAGRKWFTLPLEYAVTPIIKTSTKKSKREFQLLFIDNKRLSRLRLAKIVRSR